MGGTSVWGLCIQALLNDRGVNHYIQSYGRDLTKQNTFREDLGRIGRTKIFPILQYAFGRKEYASKIQQEKYDFLRTKEFYNVCMQLNSFNGVDLRCYWIDSWYIRDLLVEIV